MIEKWIIIIREKKDEEPGLIEIWWCTCFMIISSCKRKVTIENLYQRERGRETDSLTHEYALIYIPMFYGDVCVCDCYVSLVSVSDSKISLQLFSRSKGKYKIHLKSWKTNVYYIREREREDKRKGEIKDTHLFLHSLIFPQS